MIRIAIILLSALLALPVFSQDVKLTSNVWPPFTNNFGEPAFAMMLVHEALGRGGRAATTSIQTFEEVMTSLESGEFDGSAALWRTDEREEFLLYSTPYLENRLILVGPKGSDVSAMKIADLKGKKVAIVGSYAYGSEVNRETGVNWVRTADDQESLDKVRSGQAEYMLVDDLLMNYLMQHQADEVNANLEVGVHTLFKRSLYFAVRKDHPNAEAIILDFDDAIADMVRDGTYNRILQINWIESDVDGDGIAELVLGGTSAGTQAPSGGYSVMMQSNEVSALAADNERYYIDGKIYDGWRNVPEQYKKKPTAPPMEGGFGPKMRF